MPLQPCPMAQGTYMQTVPVLATVSLALWAGTAGALENPFRLSVHQNGSYSLSLGQADTDLLQSAPMGVQSEGRWCGEGCLRADHVSTHSGADALGSYLRTVITWQGGGPGGVGTYACICAHVLYYVVYDMYA